MINPDRVKVVTEISVKKSFTMDEAELHSLLEEHGRQVLGATEHTNVTVTIECSRGYVTEVHFEAEFITREEV